MHKILAVKLLPTADEVSHARMIALAPNFETAANGW